MAKLQVKKRGDVYQYVFEVAPVNGVRKWKSKSGFKTKSEANREGVKDYNEYIQTGQSFVPTKISYSDYWMQQYCQINLQYRTIESYATKSLRNGVEIRDVADILGHSKMEATENYYISSTEETLKEASEKFEQTTQSKTINEIIKFKN